MSSLEEIFIEHLQSEGLDAKAIILIVADMFPVFKAVAESWLKQKLYPDPEPCIMCGVIGEHRHHPDYEKPLEIVWLCESCHHKLHPRNKKVRTIQLYISS